jgi:hypothetical protein
VEDLRRLLRDADGEDARDDEQRSLAERDAREDGERAVENQMRDDVRGLGGHDGREPRSMVLGARELEPQRAEDDRHAPRRGPRSARESARRQEGSLARANHRGSMGVFG